ncbi:hypothetical protein Ciccas_010223 [Cichlidogyrus casuarinus]|uniref:Ig-like domain-containing protein n=1 Tax=Cichlidogyrus casuarinus TaxID=1844966 RepID=A0ABD2PUR2_9PLAT
MLQGALQRIILFVFCTNPLSFVCSQSEDIEHNLLIDIDKYSEEVSKVNQSRKCTEEEMKKKIQCFSVLPEEIYKVAEGDTVTMKCTVQNQHGKAQWRAGNILLGHDRAIQAHPRLSIIGDSQVGEHFLQIEKVKREDAMEYECQVGPTSTQELLRKSTNLTVIGELLAGHKTSILDVSAYSFSTLQSN